MGQAAVDLPDTPAPPSASAASTDDLLAQMAGEEIDRLLAEADDRPDGAAARPAESLQPQPFLSPAKPAPTTESSEPDMKGSTPELNASEAEVQQLHGFLGGLADGAGPDPVAELASRGGASGGTDRADPLDDGDSAAERAALASSARSTTADGNVPLPIRVLAWINSPFDACPDHVREALGKVAILTAVNAIAVLAYVLFFRHH